MYFSQELRVKILKYLVDGAKYCKYYNLKSLILVSLGRSQNSINLQILTGLNEILFQGLARWDNELPWVNETHYYYYY